MSNQVFQQNLNDKKGPQPGGPFLIQMLFREKVPMPDKAAMTAIMEKHIGPVSASAMIKRRRALPHWSISRSSRTPRPRCS